tara:strand:- start:43078 stop:43206 length:129 start_codon:yes stop_codon:yes gene_type:complete
MTFLPDRSIEEWQYALIDEGVGVDCKLEQARRSSGERKAVGY